MTEFSKEELADLMSATTCAAWQAARDCRIIGSPSLKETLMEEVRRYECLQRKIKAMIED